MAALLLALVLGFSGHRPAPAPRITLLVMKGGCPNSPKLRARLTKAAASLHLRFEVVDLGKLRHGDPRTGYPAPTILVNGRDLFGMRPPEPSDVRACREYPGGLPSVQAIRAKLRLGRH